MSFLRSCTIYLVALPLGERKGNHYNWMRKKMVTFAGGYKG